MLGKAKVLLPLVLFSICNGLIADELVEHKINCRYVQPETVKNFINIGTTEETPRQILEEDFFSKDPNNPYGGSIPISGGWGYTKDTSVIIDKYDPVVNQAMPFDGVGIEYTFIEKRIYEELIIFKPPEHQLYGIKWKKLDHKLLKIDQRTYDYHRYFVAGHLGDDWNYLKNIYSENDGFSNDPEGLENHLRLKEELSICYETDYWFDITSFY